MLARGFQLKHHATCMICDMFPAFFAQQKDVTFCLSSSMKFGPDTFVMSLLFQEDIS